MEETKDDKQATGSKRGVIFWKPLLLLGFLFLPVTAGTQLLMAFTGGMIILYLLIKLLDWFLRWAWARIRRRELFYQHQWLETGLCAAIFAIVIAVHAYAISQADQMALEIGTQIQATCDSGKACSIPEKFLAIGKGTNTRRVKIPFKSLGKEYPIRLTMTEDHKNFTVRVFHAIQMGLIVYGGVGKNLESDSFWE